jgi:hypothetical protein
MLKIKVSFLNLTAMVGDLQYNRGGFTNPNEHVR